MKDKIVLAIIEAYYQIMKAKYGRYLGSDKEEGELAIVTLLADFFNNKRENLERKGIKKAN